MVYLYSPRSWWFYMKLHKEFLLWGFSGGIQRGAVSGFVGVPWCVFSACAVWCTHRRKEWFCYNTQEGALSWVLFYLVRQVAFLGDATSREGSSLWYLTRCVGTTQKPEFLLALNALFCFISASCRAAGIFRGGMVARIRKDFLCEIIVDYGFLMIVPRYLPILRGVKLTVRGETDNKGAAS